MDAKAAKLWTAKLRSGEIKQWRGKLRQGDMMCALGVLCEVMGSKWHGNIAAGINGLSTCVTALPSDVAVAAGMKSVFGNLGDPDHGVMSLNDDKEWDFNQIADWIDEHVEEL